jgi:hypothetical protein
LTGMATSPNETVSDAIDLKAMRISSGILVEEQVPAPMDGSLRVE